MAPSLRVGSSEEETGAPARDPDADACVVCLGEPKSHILVPCGHQCVGVDLARRGWKVLSGLAAFCGPTAAHAFNHFRARGERIDADELESSAPPWLSLLFPRRQVHQCLI